MGEESKCMIRKVYNWLRGRCLWLRPRELISGFIVTLLGVLVALLTTSYIEHRHLDKLTKERLHIATLEIQRNHKASEKILSSYVSVSPKTGQ